MCSSYVLVQGGLLRESVVANRTLERFLSSVSSHVGSQMTRGKECHWTMFAGIVVLPLDSGYRIVPVLDISDLNEKRGRLK